MDFLKLAIRNVFRNRRRTLLNMAAFVVCLSMIIFFVGLYRFRIVDGVAKATRYRSGHVQVHARGYDAVSRKLPLKPAIADGQPILAALRSDPRVRMAAERIRFFSYITHGERASHSTAVAVSPEAEKQASLLPECVIKGRYLRDGDAGVLITERLARSLKVSVGDSVRLKMRNTYDVANIADAEVVGIVRPPFNSLDQTVFFLPLAFARELLSMDSASTEILVLAHDSGQAQDLVRDLPGRLDPALASAVEAFDWKHYETALVADIFMDTRFLAFFFAILLSISVFIMSNSMSMTVFERIREFGTMRAIGMSRNGLLALLATESTLIGLMGSLAGCGVAGLLCWYFGIYGIPTDVGELSSIPVSPRFYSMSSPIEFAGCLVLGALLGCCGGLRAALRARSVNIVRILQAE